MSKKSTVISIALVAVIVGGGWHYFGSAPAGGAPGGPGMAIPVTVQTIEPAHVRVWTEFSGRLQAVNSADIKPQVGGRITEVRFEDGAEVKAGDVLFVIDPRPYEDAVAKAEADVATAKTNANFAKLELGRATGMMKTQAIAQRIYDERANASRGADAAVKAADAELKQAQLDLDYAYVKAPIDGRAGRAELTVGNLVQTGPNTPLLTSVVSDDSIYADFEVDEQTYMQSIRSDANDRAQERQIPVEMTVQGDKEHRYTGMIYTFDNHIDAASGTIRARAKFDNPGGALVPGMFVTVRLAGGNDAEALVVPQKALGFDQDKKFVYVVGKDDKVAYHEVMLGQEVKDQRIVLSGIAAGDRVIVDGMQHVHPDALVAPTESTDKPEAPAADKKADADKPDPDQKVADKK